MSISFSGLASGLDTTSWVESMTALKRAKVEGYEEEKKEVVSTQETLNNIKSFFSSFRSMIEKVTDAKFGVAETDIFAQKLATSSEPNVVTASVTPSAEEGVYDIEVDNLATSTKATSGFVTMTTILQSQTATLGSTLGSLGVKSGDIAVTVNSTRNVITLDENDTLADFISDLKNIGADASYNEKTGVFCVNLSGGSIDDTLAVQPDGSRGTGILDALGLESTGGYESTNLEITTTETLVTAATGATKLSQLGSITAGDIRITSDSGSFDLSITGDTTLQNILDALTSRGIDASLDSDGVFTIRDAEISDIGGTGFMEALGLETDVYSKTQSSGALQTETVTTSSSYADGNTKLSELSGWDEVGANPVIEVQKPDGSNAVINVTGDTTLNDIMSELAGLGVSASLSDDGVLFVSGGKISGNVAEFLGIDSISENSGGIYTAGQVLYATQTIFASGSTSLGDLGIGVTKAAGDLAVYNSSNQLVAELNVDSTTTLNDLFSMLSAYGIIGSVNDGRIVLTSANGNYVMGDVADALGLGTVSSVVTTGSSMTSTAPVVGTVTINADETTSFGEIGLDVTDKELVVNSNSSSGALGTITVSNSSTFGELFSELAGYGINGSIVDGKIVLDTGADKYVTGDLASILGIGVTSNTTTGTTGASITSSAPLTYVTTEVADSSSLISDFITIDSNNQILIHNGSTTTTFTVTDTTTFGDMLNAFTSAGVDASMSNGRINFDSTNGNYVEDLNSTSGVLQSLGIGVIKTTIGSGETVTITGSIEYSSESVVMMPQTSYLSDTTEFGQIWNGGYANEKAYLNISDLRTDTSYSYTIWATDTFADLDNLLTQDFGNALSAKQGYIIINGYLKDTFYDCSGSFFDAMSQHISTKFKYVNTSKDSSITLKIRATQSILPDDTNAELIIGSLLGDYDYIGAYSGDKVTDFIADLQSYDFNVYFSSDGTELIVDTLGSTYHLAGLVSNERMNSVFDNIKDSWRCNTTKLSDTSISKITTSMREVNSYDTLYNVLSTRVYTDIPILTVNNNTLTVSSNRTIAELIEEINDFDFGILATFVNGKLTIRSYSDTNLTLSKDIARVFNMSVVEEEIGDVQEGVIIQKKYATEDSKIFDYIEEDLFPTYYKDIVLNSSLTSDSYATISISETTTFAQLIDFFNSSGNYASLDSGILNIELTNSYFEESRNVFIEALLGYRAPLAITIEESPSVTEDTLLTSLGSGIKVGTVIEDAYYSTMKFTVQANSTVGDLIDRNPDFYIVTQSLNGKSYLDYRGQPSDIGNDVLHYLGLSNRGTGYRSGDNIIRTYTSRPLVNITATRGTITGSNTSSNEQTSSTTYTAGQDTTLGTLGMSSDGTVTIQESDGSFKTVTVSASETINDLENKLSSDLGVSFADGKITISGSELAWVTSISENLKDILNLPGVGKDFTYTTTENTTTSNTQSTIDLENTSSSFVDENMELGTIDGYTNGNGAVTIHKADGSEVTITLRADDTLGDFFNMIAGHGLSGMVSSSGIVTITGADGAYLSAVSGGSNILTALKFENATFNTKTVFTNTTNGVLQQEQTGAANGSIKLEDLELADGTKINFDASDSAALILSLTNKNGTVRTTTINFTKTQTLDDVLQAFTANGLSAHIEGSRIAINTNTLADFDISGTLGSFLMGNYIKTYETGSKTLTAENTTTITSAASRDTLLSEFGVTTGEYNIFSNGVKYTAYISSDETLGSFMDTLKSFGIQTGLIVDGNQAKLIITGQGDSYVAASANTSSASNVVEKLFGSTIEESFSYRGEELLYNTITQTQTATTATLLSEFDTPWGDTTLKSAGDLYLTVNGENKVIHISETETFGSLINKLREAGVVAALLNGKLYISNSGELSIDSSKTTSALINPYANLKLTYKDDLPGFYASNDTVKETTTTIEESTLSAANYADLNTQLKTLNITSGSLTIYRDGLKALINIDEEQTFADLRSQIAGKFSDVDLKFENGKLVVYSKTDGVNLDVGNTTDTSNFLAITGMTKSDDAAGLSLSANALYAVNSDSVITDSGLFRKGDVKEGTFIVGMATFTINDDTTIADIVSQINNNEDANATAYWDSVDGKMVIQSRTTGAALINIEAGTSNFTDILGYTNSTWNSNGSVKNTKINLNAQEIGENAQFRINGVRYTASSNTITSDISRIQGVTLNLKDVSNGKPVQLTIEKDKETVANALSDIVDSYNELMKNVDEAIAVDGELHDQTVLKMIRNQLRNLMTSSDLGTTVFRNLDAIGISVSDANSSNIETTNDRIINLSFDKDKFFKVYDANAQAVKELLIGGDNNKGIFINIETLLDSALEDVTGYFASANESYQNEINRLENKIIQGNKQVERYKEQLEHKFASMDMLIGQVQQQYSTFLLT